jgi:hypothetical protein
MSDSAVHWPHGKPVRLQRRFGLMLNTAGRWQIAGTGLGLERQPAGWTLVADDPDWGAFLFRHGLQYQVFDHRRDVLRAVGLAAHVDDQLLRPV